MDVGREITEAIQEDRDKDPVKAELVERIVKAVKVRRALRKHDQLPKPK